MVVFCGLRILSSLGILMDGKLGTAIYTLVIQIGILFVLPLFLYCILLKNKPRKVFKTCNFDKVNFKIIIISFAIGILCFFVNIAVSSLFNGILTFTGYKFTGGTGDGDFSTLNFFIDLFLVAVLPGFCEEFLHRGIVLQGTKHMGFKKSILISSILFALLHFNIQQVSYAFVIGLILGLVSVVSKNIIPAMIIHFTNNAISTYIDYAQNRGWWLGDFLDKIQEALVTNQAITIFVVSVVIMLGVVILLCLFVWLLYKQSILRKVDKAINKVYDSDFQLTKNSPVRLGHEDVIMDLLENSTLLNLNYKKMDNPIDIVMPKEKSRYLATLKDKLFMWGSIVLGAIITLFTYIWGLL